MPARLDALWSQIVNGPDGLVNYLAVAAVMFTLGVIAMITRRNAIGLLMGVELILNAAGLNFVAFSRFTAGPWQAPAAEGVGAGGLAVGAVDGQVFALFIIVLAAAEAAIALALVLAIFKRRHTIDVAQVADLRG